MPPEARKKCPGAAGGGIPGGGEVRRHHRPPLHRGQLRTPNRTTPIPPDPRKVSRVTADQPHDFVCAWCGEPNPWSRMEGHDGHLKFCADCVRLMDTIEFGASEARK